MPEYFQIHRKITKLLDGSTRHRKKVIFERRPAVPICILEDPAYPLLPFLMKEFANGGRIKKNSFRGIAYRLQEWS